MSILTRKITKGASMSFLALYRYYRFLDMSIFQAARLAYQLRRR